MKLSLLLLAAAVATPAVAADKPLFLTGGPKAEDALRRFVERDPAVKAKLDEAARREDVILAAERDPDLRDAVSDAGGPDRLKLQLAQATGPDRAALLQQLPGLAAPEAPTCRALSECASPELSVQVSDPALLPDALRRAVRPWMLIQAARGSEVELTPAAGAGDAALQVGLKGLSAAPLTLNVTPNLGGFKVWFERPQEIAALYAQARETALKSAR
jgi:hypothetical protein